jgi:hypothetical protein
VRVLEWFDLEAGSRIKRKIPALQQSQESLKIEKRGGGAHKIVDMNGILGATARIRHE